MAIDKWSSDRMIACIALEQDEGRHPSEKKRTEPKTVIPANGPQLKGPGQGLRYFSKGPAGSFRWFSDFRFYVQCRSRFFYSERRPQKT
ncbi:hypothetical protein NYA22BAC_00269 [Parasphingorhabdus sp. NYA22]